MKGKNISGKLGSRIKGMDIVLFVLSKSDYALQIKEIVKSVAEQNKKICYVSANRSADVLATSFKAEGIDVRDFWFIDCISRTASAESYTKKSQKDAVILFVDSPRSMTDLSISISGAINNGVKNVFVDALSTFLIYNETVMVVRFVHNLISRLRESSGRGFFVVLKSDISSAILGDLTMFVDRVVEI